MDTFSYNTLLRHGIGNTILTIGQQVYALDIKSEVNINQLAAFKPSPLPLSEILSPFAESPDIYKAIAKRQPQPV